jgi:hypothetical protein
MAWSRAWRYFAIAACVLAAGAVVVAAATATHAVEGDHYFVRDAALPEPRDAAQ